jgi:uncharacterized protein involved in type VI secretion and phage assembly
MIRDAYGNPRFFGLYRGVVVDNNDPNPTLNRVKLKVPQVLFEATTSWAWPVEASGANMVKPDIGQGVWVMFEGGDPSFPIWTGVFGGKFGVTEVATVTPPASTTTQTLIVGSSTTSTKVPVIDGGSA